MVRLLTKLLVKESGDRLAPTPFVAEPAASPFKEHADHKGGNKVDDDSWFSASFHDLASHARKRNRVLIGYEDRVQASAPVHACKHTRVRTSPRTR